MGRHVLLIEDEANIVEAIRFILTRDGWRVDTHSNGATALNTVRSVKPDAIVLDAMLPHKSGFDILRDIRADADLRHIPVLMLTARGQDKDKEMALAAGADRYMTKPFSNAAVLSVLDGFCPNPQTKTP